MSRADNNQAYFIGCAGENKVIYEVGERSGKHDKSNNFA